MILQALPIFLGLFLQGTSVQLKLHSQGVLIDALFRSEEDAEEAHIPLLEAQEGQTRETLGANHQAFVK